MVLPCQPHLQQLQVSPLFRTCNFPGASRPDTLGSLAGRSCSQRVNAWLHLTALLHLANLHCLAWSSINLQLPAYNTRMPLPSCLGRRALERRPEVLAHQEELDVAVPRRL